MATELKQPAAVPITLAAGVTALGVGLGFAVPTLARWLIRLIERTPFPVHGIIDLAGDLPLVWSVGIVGALGVAAGLYIARAARSEALSLRVDDDHLEYRQEDRTGWIDRQDVSAAFRDERDLVLLDHRDRVRARLDADALYPPAVRDALHEHRYPWHDSDPHEAQYVDWIDGRPGFTDEEHALLRRRHRERKNPAAREAIDDELATRGLVLRLRNGTVQVRRAGPDGTEPGNDTRRAGDSGTDR